MSLDLLLLFHALPLAQYTQMGNSWKQKLGLKLVRCCGGSSALSIEPTIILKRQFLPVLCVGTTSCKGYIIALHQLTSPTLLRILTDSASQFDCDGKAAHAVPISCEPHTFEATFCLLQRSFKGLIHIPLSHNGGAC